MSIVLENICKSFDGKTVLNNISFTFPKKGICNIKGASGSGKTTLLRIIMGLLKPDSGNVWDDGQVFSPVFPENRLLGSLSVFGNVEAVCGDGQKAKAILETVGLGDYFDNKPVELSTGMCRRTALARALAFEGDVLVLDEPLGGIDREMCVKLMEIILEYSEKRLVILVDHKQELVRKFADCEISL